MLLEIYFLQKQFGLVLKHFYKFIQILLKRICLTLINAKHIGLIFFAHKKK